MTLPMFFLLVLLVVFIATLVGLVSPRALSRKGAAAPTRLKVVLVGVGLMLAMIVGIGVTAPKVDRTAAARQADAASQPAQLSSPMPNPPPVAAGNTPNQSSPPAPPVAPAAAVKPATAANEPKCDAEDLRCLGEAGIIYASARCVREIERLAEYSVKWTDGMLEMKFSHFRWTGKPGGGITFIGDKVQFQNGFGAFAPMVYQCDMTKDAQRVIAVRAAKGRLPINR